MIASSLLTRLLSRPAAGLSLLSALILISLASLTRLPLRDIPPLKRPVLHIHTVWPGYPPGEVRESVTIPLEEGLSSLGGLKRMVSESRRSLSMITATLDWGCDRASALQEARQIAGNLRSQLPDGARPPVVTADQGRSGPLMRLGIFPRGLARRELKKRVKEEVRDPLACLEGVGRIDMTGGLNPEVRLEVSRPRLQSLGLSLADVARQWNQQNSNFPGGILRDSRREWVVQTRGRPRSLAEAAATPLLLPDGEILPLDQWGTLRWGTEDSREFFLWSRGTAVEGILLEVYAREGENPLTTSRRIRDELELREKQSAPPWEVRILEDRSDEIRKRSLQLASAAGAGMILVFLLLRLTMGSWGLALLPALAVPLSLLPVLPLLAAGRMTLNAMTLGGMTLGIGMSVDSSVVVLNQLVHRKASTPGEIASLTGERAPALASSTLTTVTVFAPLFFLPGVMGILYRGMAVTVSLVLLFSLAASLLWLPLFYRLLFSQAQALPSPPPWTETLKFRLGRHLSRRGRPFFWGSLAVAAALTAGGAGLAAHRPLTLFPQGDRGVLEISLSPPPGTTRKASLEAGSRLLDRLTAHEKVSSAWLTWGGTGSMDQEPGDLSGHLRLVPDRRPSAQRMAAQLQREAEDLLGTGTSFQTRLPAQEMASLLEAPPDRLIRFFPAADEGETEAVVDRLKGILPRYSGAIIPRAGIPVNRLYPDQARLQRFGSTPRDLGQQLFHYTRGIQAAPLEIEGRLVPLRIVDPAGEGASQEALSPLQLTPTDQGAQGKPFFLSQAVRWSKDEELSRYLRVNRQDAVRLSLPRTAEARRLLTTLEDQSLKPLPPPSRGEGVSLMLVFLLAAALVYCLLGAQFSSPGKPLFILALLPPSAAGSLSGLALLGQPLCLEAALGGLVCLGLGVNNGILLLDKGKAEGPGLTETWKSRLIPLSVTTGTTFLSLLPLAAGGQQSPGRCAMAAVIMGGLLFSALAALFLLPRWVQRWE